MTPEWRKVDLIKYLNTIMNYTQTLYEYVNLVLLDTLSGTVYRNVHHVLQNV